MSITVTVWATVPLTLPQPSIALHVIVSERVPGQLPPTVTSLTNCTVAPLQASDAVGVVNTGIAGHEIVALAPAEPIVGATLSMTVIVWLTVAL